MKNKRNLSFIIENKLYKIITFYSGLMTSPALEECLRREGGRFKNFVTILSWSIISCVVQLFNLFSRPEKYEKDIRDIVEYFERKKEKKISAGSGDEVDTRFPPFPHFIVNLRKHHRGGNCH